MAVRNVFSRMTLMTTRELPNTCNIRATNPWNSLELTPDSLFVTSRYSIERDERINLVLGMEASFDHSYAVF